MEYLAIWYPGDKYEIVEVFKREYNYDGGYNIIDHGERILKDKWTQVLFDDHLLNVFIADCFYNERELINSIMSGRIKKIG